MSARDYARAAERQARERDVDAIRKLLTSMDPGRAATWRGLAITRRTRFADGVHHTEYELAHGKRYSLEDAVAALMRASEAVPRGFGARRGRL